MVTDPRARLRVVAREIRQRHEGSVASRPDLRAVHDALREPPDRASAVLRALASAGVHRELVVASGWTPEAYERWLGDALADALL